uniref:Uncharacterized protein n=1 Tax=Spumella elongata TaxID=89044 RepID=A0A7S3HCU5_9STRA|mmetsp:Transcript_4618/g.7717  ORF Transcript_4618/g.7717 Transcript_4618/m.7717 type:complete len:106 (+) Transcript_4618:24-341(+)|eukprot:CAMPEP_0184970392 /NCGR_PEP_ID=MMETSP1098-20130426/2898_1 /TAXON_ID=89044 /ORGANISM="Spumella elongata, Strain CCAP 955/1" /LENGTH=105 /DNA_ID=CAMNT_0027492329 /DNA_START=27 /DNA_END=344 /DNA_ORIENTATION=-
MSFASFTIGLVFSTAASIWSFEKLRDRRLLFDKKFTETEVMNYLYKMKLRNKMDTAREGGERGLLDETRVLVNEHVVKNVHSASNNLFSSQPLQAFKKFIEENTK